MSPHSTWYKAWPGYTAIAAMLLSFLCAAEALTAQAAAQTDEMPGIWAKICNKTADPNDTSRTVERCVTQFEAFSREGVSILAVAVAPVESQEREVLSIAARLTSMGLALLRGAQAVIDETSTINLRFTFCFIERCLAETSATDEVLELLKSGKTMRVVLTSAMGEQITLPVPLENFAGVYAGPAVDAKKYAEGRRQFLEAYRKSLAEPQKDGVPAQAGAGK